MPLVEAELRRLARHCLRGERADHTLQTTALVNEVYLRLRSGSAKEWNDRAHFLAVASRCMREILVDHARARSAKKRGGERGGPPARLTREPPARSELDADTILAVHEALVALEALDPRQARVVELHVFGGLTHEEAAGALQVSVATVRREWIAARAWLHERLQGDAPARRTGS